MKKNYFILLSLLLLVFTQCTDKCEDKQTTDMKNITEQTVTKVQNLLIEKFGPDSKELIERGVAHAASLWRTSDGSEIDFENFCSENYINDASEKQMVFEKISKNFESLWGHGNKILLDLNENMHLDNGPYHKVDAMFAAYSPGAHFADDFYANKIAFVIALNFPPYSLDEKNDMGKNWTNLQWAYARLGDVFTARVPANLSQAISNVATEADIYISEYNIYMGHLLNDKGEKLFPEDMVLLSHWNLRDEIKSNYANKEIGLEKQDMIYTVMKRIIDQSIPEKVINSGSYDWNPLTNKVFENGAEIQLASEPDTRYQQIVNNFNALKATDSYYTDLNTFIKRSFSGEKEIPQEEVEKLFDEYLSSPVAKEVGKLISKRLGRDLRPYDIWYDGFKARSSISEESLNAITEKKYPDAKALEADLSNILVKLGWSKERAQFLASKISVDPARGSGHAWGAQMKSEKAHLRTRISGKGMNYKGYNIAVHEFGHNVEQTISLHDVDYYMMNGVPNTAFTEATAFIFQKRDLQLLGINDPNPDKEYLETLDLYWQVFEIMGVSMVDMKVWKWLYENPEATAAQLKEAVIQISKDVWNTYYSEIYGIKDEPILAIYTHMISNPLYLANYSFGHLIDFQIENYITGKNFAAEVDRIWSIGRLTPDAWMQKAVGESISIKPMIEATEEALKHIN
ncbi:MAG: hypothetical protein A2X13_12675 [Bacteroidetes bacterium GWC2_33_15]|nr:MAG: hypothetical protein A2X10_14020 [Bacteroidetes bacterium GWA2_33_15]OFX50707.1 MAG: hypothetical protein A2X13_12675 [Bacteroidetes bacterium GWC2_33_15]OFX63279.1 MAG: hypothetical protein A2X15_02125 [Bacteroidetes bacterium GWB2_32_14]OFX69856.1 MAG: hypothetical protein A2X14_05350 [Bacteroidetes bacterium GWD2_33_33]HAN19830.1 hypothetical protein [Bacteroidales bacterium]